MKRTVAIVLALATFAALGGSLRHNLAARGATAGGGATGPTAKDYVQNGLICCFDGIENNGYGNHTDVVGDRWYSLVGDGYITLSTRLHSWDSDALAVTPDGVRSVGHSLQSAMNDAVAIEVVVRFNDTGNAQVLLDSATVNHGICFSAAGVVSQLSRSYIQTGATFGSMIYGDTAGYYIKWGVCAWRNSSAATNAKAQTYATSGLANNFGMRYYGSRLDFKGRVYAIRMYSTYSQETYEHNYAVDKARFGLP